MRADLLLALLLLSPALHAGDLGSEVTFGGQHGIQFRVLAGSASGVAYDSGPSDAPSGDWDTVLIQGELPDPSIRIKAARTSAHPVWFELQIRRFPDGRFWARGSLPKGTGGLRLQLVGSGIKADHAVTVYGAEVFADAPAAREVPTIPTRGPMDPEAKPPVVHGRAQWSAKPPTHPLTPDPLPWRVTLHHTDGRYTATLAESLQEARFIQDFHQNGRKWSDIAYHFLVDPLGNILEGRPLETLGAHTLNNNEGNVGIVLLGEYHPPNNNQPTHAQLGAVGTLGHFLVKRFGLDPASLKGHRDYKKTDCPGDLAYPKLAELRLAFAAEPLPPSPPSPGVHARVPLSPRVDWDGQRDRNNAAIPNTTR